MSFALEPRERVLLKRLAHLNRRTSEAGQPLGRDIRWWRLTDLEPQQGDRATLLGLVKRGFVLRRPRQTIVGGRKTYEYQILAGGLRALVPVSTGR